MVDKTSKGNPVAAISDNVLVERLNQGDVASFETLFFRHYDRVYGLLFRLLGNRAEAEDVAQEVFIKLYQKPLSGRRDHNVSAWLYRVATNKGYNQIRGRNRRWLRDLSLVSDATDAPLDPSEVAARNDSITIIRAALIRLPERQAKLLLLRQMGLSYAELADTCGIASGSVGKTLSRAADAFRIAYEKENRGHGLAP